MIEVSVKEMIQILRAQGFSEEAIAYGADVNKSSISRIVTGKTHSPRYHVANKIELIFRQYAWEVYQKNISCTAIPGTF